MEWILIPLLKNGPKLIHLAEACRYFQRTAFVLHAGEFFENKVTRVGEFSIRSACADGSTIGSRLPLSCILCILVYHRVQSLGKYLSNKRG